jgi:hypothetical protein
MRTVEEMIRGYEAEIRRLKAIGEDMRTLWCILFHRKYWEDWDYACCPGGWRCLKCHRHW